MRDFKIKPTDRQKTAHKQGRQEKSGGRRRRKDRKRVGLALGFRV
jgi:hypothetical protein